MAYFNNHPETKNYPFKITYRDKFNSLINIIKGNEEFVLDTNGVIMSSNLEVVTVTGYQEHEVIGKSFAMFYSEQDREKHIFEQDLHLTLLNGKNTLKNFKVKKHGENFLAKTKFWAIIKEGEHTGFRITLSDGYHVFPFWMRPSRTKEEQTILYNNPFVGIFKANLVDFSIIQLNEKALEILKPDVKLGFLKDIFYHERDYFPFLEILLKEGQVNSFPFQVNSCNGIDVFCNISCTLFKPKNIVTGIINDVSELRNQVAKCQKIKGELDTFLYRASHDMRGPLARILGISNLIILDKSAPIDAMLNSIKLIKKDAMELDLLLKDLSDISYNNRNHPKIQEIELDQLLKGIIEPFKEMFPFVKVEVSGMSQRTLVHNDLVRITVALRNVISNAFIYHNPSQEVSSFVRIEYECNGSNIIFKVEDNGVGIEQDSIENIYDPFFRTNTAGSGPGLGLFIARKMVDKLGGTIYVASQPSKGTLVTVILKDES